MMLFYERMICKHLAQIEIKNGLGMTATVVEPDGEPFSVVRWCSISRLPSLVVVSMRRKKLQHDRCSTAGIIFYSQSEKCRCKMRAMGKNDATDWTFGADAFFWYLE